MWNHPFGCRRKLGLRFGTETANIETPDEDISEVPGLPSILTPSFSLTALDGDDGLAFCRSVVQDLRASQLALHLNPKPLPN